MRDKSYGTEKVLELRVDSSKDFIQQVQDKIGDKIDKVANKFTVR
jgi:hypothetical protein